MNLSLGKTNITLSSGTVGGTTTSVTQAASPTKVVYPSVNSGTSWAVPSSVTSITVKAWGAGGGGGGGGDSGYSLSGGDGGGAGFERATMRSAPGRRSPSGWAAGHTAETPTAMWSTSAAAAAAAAIQGSFAAPRR